MSRTGQRVRGAVGAITAAAMAAGCSTTRPEPQKAPTLADDPAIQTIQTAVEHIKEQNEALVQVERAMKPTAAPPAKPDDEAFSRPVNLREWSGPATDALNEVAAVMGYRVELNGRIPAIEPLVSLDVRGAEAYSVLNEIADQGERVYDVRVDVPNRRIVMAFRQKEG